MNAADSALLELLRQLATREYRFVTATPATHAIVVARSEKRVARDLRDIFGWSLPFSRDVVPEVIFSLLQDAEMLTKHGGMHRSLVRVASLGPLLFLHSAFPTEDRDAVFFGPDSYRFVRFLLAELKVEPAEKLIDIGSGAGVGGIAAMVSGEVPTALLTDINETALRYARVNAAHAGADVTVKGGSGPADAEGFPLAIMNPPFIASDGCKRVYRDGGGSDGAQLSIDWAIGAARRIARGGRVLLYSGSAIIDGEDRLESALRARLPADCTMRYAEIDPDIFGEELGRATYSRVERIAAIGAVIKRQGYIEAESGT